MNWSNRTSVLLRLTIACRRAERRRDFDIDLKE